VAGPSEVIVVADGAADPAWVAADLLAQAEHDPMARALCITDSAELLQRVARALEGRLAALPRRDIAGPALEANGALIRVATLEDAVELANRLAPEHLELMVRVPAALLPHLLALARVEGLAGHGSAAEVRLTSDGGTSG